MISRLEGWIMLQISCNHHLMSTCCQAFECFYRSESKGKGRDCFDYFGYGLDQESLSPKNRWQIGGCPGISICYM